MLEINVSETEEIYTGKMTLVAHDVDCADRWKLSSVFGNTQEIANYDSFRYHCDWITLRDRYDACFVLTRMKVKMYLYPGSSDAVFMSTWPGAKPRVIWNRYFTFHTEDGELIGEASSQWVLLNRTSRTVMRPSSFDIRMPDTGAIPIPFALDRGAFDFTPEKTTERMPVYSDIDYNGHVNNARYIEWILDLFPPEQFYRYQIAELDIKYEQEIRWGQKVFLDFLFRKEDNIFFVKGRGEDGETFFRTTGVFCNNGESV